MIGALVSGLTLTTVACSDGEGCDGQTWVLLVPILGIPGGLLGALIGSQAGGPVEIIP